MIQHVDALGRLPVYYKEDHAQSIRECIQEAHSPRVFSGITANYVLIVQLHIFMDKHQDQAVDYVLKHGGTHNSFHQLHGRVSILSPSPGNRNDEQHVQDGC